jgi:uncharacterized phage protein (TIGR01671 family)
MREIKVRGLNNGKWVYGSLRSCLDGSCFIIFYEDSTIHELQVDPETVGQYTGIYDKNGKKICEGDIIKWTEAAGYDDGIGVIEWEKNHCAFFVINDDDNIFDTIYDFNYWETEVIGNIHKNHELLEEA